MSQMQADVQKRIRSLPGNNMCCDCEAVNPQWCSVTYGSLMCLECSGHHRSLGVHLSFVRSIQMDSFTEKQIAAMERSGGNDKLVEFFKSKGIEKTVRIPTKYGTKQAAYYRDRLTRQLEGRTEPPPDPGRWDPVTGVSEAQGAEPLPGETTDAYNARQGRLREEARERMRAKFGQGGMSGLGSSGSMGSEGSGGGGSDEGIGGMLGGAVSGIGSFFKEKVIDNEKVRGAVGGAVSGVGGAYNSLKQSERFGGAVDKVGGVVGAIAGKAGEKLGVGAQPNGLPDGSKANIAQQEREFWDRMYQKPDSEPAQVPQQRMSAPDVSIFRQENVTRSTSTPGKSFGGNGKAKAVDDDWGDWGDDFGQPAAAPPPEPLQRAATEPAARVKAATDAGIVSTPTSEPERPKPAAAPTNGSAAPPSAGSAPTKVFPPEKPPMMNTAPVASSKKSPAKLATADDFFADFGM